MRHNLNDQLCHNTTLTFNRYKGTSFFIPPILYQYGIRINVLYVNGFVIKFPSEMYSLKRFVSLLSALYDS
jgi:hypothetical protein